MNNLGELIASNRKRIGYSVKELARYSNVTEKMIEKWEENKRYPTIPELNQLAYLFDLTFDLMADGRRRYYVKAYNPKNTFFNKFMLFAASFILVVGIMFFLDYGAATGRHIQDGAFYVVSRIHNSDREERVGTQYLTTSSSMFKYELLIDVRGYASSDGNNSSFELSFDISKGSINSSVDNYREDVIVTSTDESEVYVSSFKVMKYNGYQYIVVSCRVYYNPNDLNDYDFVQFYFELPYEEFKDGVTEVRSTEYLPVTN